MARHWPLPDHAPWEYINQVRERERETVTALTSIFCPCNEEGPVV